MKRIKCKSNLILIKAANLKNWSIFNKIFGCFCLIFIFMIVLTYITFINYRNDKEKSILKVINQSSQQTQNKIDDYFNDLNNITKFPLYRQYSDNRPYYYDSFLKCLDVFSLTNNRDLYFQKILNSMFIDIFNYKKSIHSVFIFNTNGIFENKLKSGSISLDYNPKNEKWFCESIEKFGRPVIISTYKLPTAFDNMEKPLYVFSMARGIVRADSSQVVGIILVNTSINFLVTLCEKILYYPSQRILIVDKNDNIIYDTLSSNITNKLDNFLNTIVSQDTANTLKVKDVKGEFLMSYYTSNLTGWKLINIIPTKELNKDLNQMRTRTTILTIIIIFFAFVLVFFFRKKLSIR